jgi:primosomal protein N' (replication factor Y)
MNAAKEYATVTPIPAIARLDALTYRIPEGHRAQLEAGMRVVVPVGRRRVTAIVTELADQAPADIECRDISEILDAEPVITAELLSLARWMAAYYAAPLADVLSLAIGRGLTASTKKIARLLDPSLARSTRDAAIVTALENAGGATDVARLAKQIEFVLDSTLTTLVKRGAVEVTHELVQPSVRAKVQTLVEIIKVPEAEEADALFARSPKRRQVFEFLLGRPGRAASMSELSELFAGTGPQVTALENAGFVKRSQSEVYRGLHFEREEDKPLVLSEHQREAIDAVTSTLGSFDTFLLQGVTASGKTEVYLRIIREVLDRGGSALVLVPEISLTHQVVARLVARFGPTVAVLHSELSAGERWDQWRRICRKEAQIAVGARSAVLAPLTGLELIVVDEEHDAAYKQEDGVRYHGRDVAIMRAREAGCPIVLGSATPSIESWRNAIEGRYRHLVLPNRVTARPLPTVEVVDLRGRDVVARGGLSEHLEQQMQLNWQAGGQTLLFLNRRGFASSLMCYECGEVCSCPNCSVSMTLHRESARLQCHHCDAARKIPKACPECNADALIAQGIGTQRLEATVAKLLPEATVARLDRDRASRKGETQRVLAAWRAGTIDVLIGTQMITKGHDAPGVTLVGVVQADLALGVPDFRAAERTFQLLAQVAGRAGRGEDRGRVIVQTYQPDHFAIAAAARHDFETFARQEITEREDLGYPPHTRMSLLRLEGPSEETVKRFAATAIAKLDALARKTDGALIVRGPAPSPIERVKNRYRYQIQLRSADVHLARHAAAECRGQLAADARRAGIRLLVDVDAVDML